MNIVIIGDGKVGHKLAELMSEEQYNIVLVDNNVNQLKNTFNELDIMCVEGDGISYEIQQEAGVPEADLAIACASRDEINMICCILAKRLGAENTIARVRNPVYYQQLEIMREDLNLNMAVNPEYAAAGEIMRVLIFPSAIKIENFARGRVELVEFKIREDSVLDGTSLQDLYRMHKIKILVCAVQRGKELVIPDGSFVIRKGDKLSIAASHREIEKLFKRMGNLRNRVRSVLLLGGSRIAYYLSLQLLQLGIEVKIIEQDRERCEELCEKLPKASIINGNAAEQSVLEEEGIGRVDATVTLTGMDEENIIMSMFARSKGVQKVITKVNGDSLIAMADEMDLDCIISPKDITANVIACYVRGMRNSIKSSNVETIYRLVDGRVEAVEFIVKEQSDCLDTALKDLNIRKNILIACIVRNREVIIPGGDDQIRLGDRVVVITMGCRLQDLAEILV